MVYVVYDKNGDGVQFDIKNDTKLSNNRVLKMLQDVYPDRGFVELIHIPKGSHLCGYCGTNVVKGTDEDRLCSECIEMFGHSFLSEL